MLDMFARLASWFGGISTYNACLLYFYQPKTPTKLLEKRK